MKKAIQIRIIPFVAILFSISFINTVTVGAGTHLEPSDVNISHKISPNFDNVIYPHSTVITSSGIATSKIAEIRIVDPGNASDIQAKIDSCPPRGVAYGASVSGCTIYIPTGNYTITNTIEINSTKNNNIILIGASSGYPNSGGGTVFIHGANITIINITGYGVNQSWWQMVKNIKIKNIYFVSDFNKTGYAISSNNNGNRAIKIINNFFYNFYDPAIIMRNSWGLHADHNSFWYCGNNVDDSYCIDYITPTWTANNYITIVNNNFKLNSSNYGAIRTQQSTDSYIAGNVIEGGVAGIRAGIGSRIIGNYIYNFKGGDGIYSGNNVVIIGNRVVMDPTATTGAGIAAYNSIFLNNVVTTGAIVAMGSSSSNVIGNTVISPRANGIGLSGAEYSIASNNVVKNCPSSYSGITITGNSRNNVIIGNSIVNCTNGVYESVNSGYGNNTIAYNNVVNNTNGIITNGNNTKIYKNMGHVTENGNTTSVANAGTITHGLVSTPTYVDLTSTAYNMTAYILDKNSTHIQVGLYYTTTGGNITGSTNISWYAEV